MLNIFTLNPAISQPGTYPPETLEHVHKCVCVCVCVCVSLFFFVPHRAACRILVPWPGIEPVPAAVEAQSRNHWTTREVPQVCLFVILLKEIWEAHKYMKIK